MIKKLDNFSKMMNEQQKKNAKDQARMKMLMSTEDNIEIGGSKNNLAQVVNYVNNPDPHISQNDLNALAEKIMSTDIQNENPMKLSWKIAREAARTYGGEPVEYTRGPENSLKAAYQFKRSLNERKTAVNLSGTSKSIINDLCDQILQQAQSFGLSLNTNRTHSGSTVGINTNIDRLKRFMLQMQDSKGNDLIYSRFWLKVQQNPEIVDIDDRFYDSDGSVYDTMPILHGIDEIEINLMNFLSLWESGSQGTDKPKELLDTDGWDGPFA